MKNMNTFMQNFRGSINSGIFAIVNRLLNLKAESGKFNANLCSMPFNIIGRIKNTGAAQYPEIFVAYKLPANPELYSSASLVITEEGGLFSHAALDLMEQATPAIIGWPGISTLRDGAWMHFSCKPGEYLKIQEQKSISESCKQLLHRYTAEHFETCDDYAILNQVVDQMIAHSNFPKENASTKLTERLQKKIEAKFIHLFSLYETQEINVCPKKRLRAEFKHIAPYLPNKLFPIVSSPPYYSKGKALLFLRDKVQKGLKLSPIIKVKVPKLFIINQETIKEGFNVDIKKFTPNFKEYVENQISALQMNFPLIARSASELEDSSAHRGAGIFSSLKARDKQNIWQALQGVIESDNSPRAQEYKNRIGASSEFLMSIIVQEYVPHATISGVLITSNDAKKWEMSQIQIVEGYGSGVEDNKTVSLLGINTKTKKIEYCTIFGVPFEYRNSSKHCRRR